nr:hypothetical protein [Tanacetum cinerariifolium]
SSRKPDHEAHSAHLAEAFGDHPRFSDQDLCALTPNMLYAQSQVEDDKICHKQDEMGYNRLKFCMRHQDESTLQYRKDRFQR